MTSAILCQVCIRMFAGDAQPSMLKGQKSYCHHMSYLSFRQAKEMKCRLCYEMWTEFHAALPKNAATLGDKDLRIQFISHRLGLFSDNPSNLLIFEFQIASSILGISKAKSTVEAQFAEGNEQPQVNISVSFELQSVDSKS
jgi:hypothetical protein